MNPHSATPGISNLVALWAWWALFFVSCCLFMRRGVGSEGPRDVVIVEPL